MIPHIPANPTDVLDVLVLTDEITSDLRTMRIGLKSLRMTWRTTSAGLYVAAVAASSLAARTAECSALLHYMVTSASELSPEVDLTPSSRSATSARKWALDLEALERAQRT
jgi:hypothetical protein